MRLKKLFCTDKGAINGTKVNHSNMYCINKEAREPKAEKKLSSSGRYINCGGTKK